MNIRQRSRSILSQDGARHLCAVAASDPRRHEPGEAKQFLVRSKDEVRLLQRTDLARPGIGTLNGLPFVPPLSRH